MSFLILETKGRHATRIILPQPGRHDRNKCVHGQNFDLHKPPISFEVKILSELAYWINIFQIKCWHKAFLFWSGFYFDYLCPFKHSYWLPVFELSYLAVGAICLSCSLLLSAQSIEWYLSSWLELRREANNKKKKWALQQHIVVILLPVGSSNSLQWLH